MVYHTGFALHHRGRERHECEPCQRTFPHRAALEQHWLNSSRHAWCQRCNKFYDSQERLKRHEERSSAHWQCSHCNIDFPNQSSRQEHYNYENICETCHREFDSRSKVRSHQKTHLPKDIPCYACGDNRMFATHSAMLIHLENGCSTTMRELDRYARQCFQWKKYVVEEYADWLEDGERDEIGEESFGSTYCYDCNKDFAVPEDLDRHLKSPVHHPYVYKCPGCSTRFSILSGLVQHVESDACDEGIHDGTGSIGKLLHYLWLKL